MPKLNRRSKVMSEITFEKAIQELEKITTELESGKLGLDESMKAYEKGA